MLGYKHLQPKAKQEHAPDFDLIQRFECEDSLASFTEKQWRYIDPAPFKRNWVFDAIAEHLEAVTRGHIRRLLINVPPRFGKSSLVSVAWPAWTWAQQINSPTSGPVAQFVYTSYSGVFSQRDSMKTRRLVASPTYQKYWGDKVLITKDQDAKSRFETTAGGYRIATSVGGTLTGDGGNILVVDDPINSIDSASQNELESVIRWWEESFQTRLNDQQKGAMVVIMQRLAEGDLAGHILDNDKNGDWTNLILPMRYDSTRSFPSLLNPKTGYEWQDPRTEEGELLWPERFSEKTVSRLETTMGKFACTPAESPVLMSDLSLKPISDVRVGDEVVGFDLRETGVSRQRLKKVKVVQTFKYKSDVVKITLSSGKTIRCTPDHKWFMAHMGGSKGTRKNGEADVRPHYRPAAVGRTLYRVCDDVMPSCPPELERDAGWLAGFFDGEGSVSKCGKKSQRKDGTPYRSSSHISFYQTCEKNKNLCDKLEFVLTSLGFNWSCMTRKVAPAHWQKSNHYHLMSGDFPLPLMQKFLHVIKPEKWRDRIIEGAYSSKFIIGKEKVVSIEPDGHEDVFALETESGNYVVWGIASSNSSAQLQQCPIPRGGGIVGLKDWMLYDLKMAHRLGVITDDELERGILKYPAFSYVLASVDTASTEKEINDYSAMTVWGVFQDERGTNRIMLIYAWKDRLLIHGKADDDGTLKKGLVERVADTCNQWKVNRLVVENKSSGIQVGQEIARLYKNAPWYTELFNPKGDKVARLYSVQPLFAQRLIYAPDKRWADMVIQEIQSFPKGKWRDLVDSTSQGLQSLRDTGLANNQSEQDEERETEMKNNDFREYKPPYQV